MKLELEFKSVAKDGLPEKSGEYFIVQEYAWGGSSVSTCYYSAKYKVFNGFDDLPKQNVEETKLDNVVAYCEVPQEWFDNLVKEI